MIALGFIETHGFVAAIAAADAMLKAANVYVLERSSAGCGLVTISVASKDVSSVQAAVDAGAMQVSQMGGCLISKHVIARPDLELEKIINLKQNISQNTQESSSALSCCGVGTVEAKPKALIERKEEANIAKMSETQMQVSTKKLPKEEKLATESEVKEKITSAKAPETSEEKTVVKAVEKTVVQTTKTVKKYTVAQLKRLSLNRLREIALGIESFSLTKEQISKSNKNVLISALSKI